MKTVFFLPFLFIFFVIAIIITIIVVVIVTAIKNSKPSTYKYNRIQGNQYGGSTEFTKNFQAWFLKMPEGERRKFLMSLEMSARNDFIDYMNSNPDMEPARTQTRFNKIVRMGGISEI